MKYKENLNYKVKTYSGAGLLQLQYQAIIEHLEYLNKAIIEDNATDIILHSDKIREILSHLLATFGNSTDEYTLKSKELFYYANEMMTKSVIENDTKYIDAIIPLIKSTEKAWAEVAKEQLKTDTSNKSVNVGGTYSKGDINVYVESKEWRG